LTIVFPPAKHDFHNFVSRNASASKIAKSAVIMRFSSKDVKTMHYFNSARWGLASALAWAVADPGWGSLGQLPPKPMWRPLDWRPFATNAPLFGAHGSRNIF